MFIVVVSNMDIKLKRLQKDYNSERDMRVEMENSKSKLDTKLQIAEVDSNVVCCCCCCCCCLCLLVFMLHLFTAEEEIGGSCRVE